MVATDAADMSTGKTGMDGINKENGYYIYFMHVKCHFMYTKQAVETTVETSHGLH